MGFIKDFGLGILLIVGRLAFVFFVIAGILAYMAYNNPSSMRGFGFDPYTISINIVYTMFGIAFIVLLISAYLSRIRKKARVKDGLY